MLKLFKSYKFGVILLLTILVAVGLVLNSYSRFYSSISIAELQNSNSQRTALKTRETAYADYLQNIDEYNNRYNLFQKEADKLLEIKKSKETISGEEIALVSENDDLIRNPKNYKPQVYTSLTKETLNQANILSISPKIEAQGLSTRVGFIDSSIANNAQNIDVYTQFSVTFTVNPTAAQLDTLQFYPKADFTKSVNNNVVTIKPNKLNRNTNYTFGIPLFGICGTNNCSKNSAIWTHGISFKTPVKQTILAGYTIQGNPIFAYAYGNANSSGKSILLTGATHGEEWRTGGLWNWVAWMDANQDQIASQNKEMIIIVEINIDGANRQKSTGRYDTAARYNSRGVNLNRNFPNQWRPCSVCGSGPASEPETQAVTGVSLVENVTHMIAYHNQWPPLGIIFLGDNSNSTTFAWSQWVSSKTGYPVGIYNGPEVNNPSGDVPGDQVVWAESVGIRGLLIEGTYKTVDDYGKNYPMYLALVQEF